MCSFVDIVSIVMGDFFFLVGFDWNEVTNLMSEMLKYLEYFIAVLF